MAAPQETSPFGVDPNKENSESSRVYLRPNVSLNIYFSRHEDREDIGDSNAYKQNIRNCDIFIPEAVGWGDAEVTGYTEISKGNRSMFRRAQNFWSNVKGRDARSAPFHLAQLEALFNTNKRILFVDVPKMHPLELTSVARSDDEKLYRTNIDDASSKLIGIFEEASPHNIQREEYITENMGPSLDKVIKSSMQLRNRQVNVFYNVGFSHFPISEDFEKAAQTQRNTTGSELPRVNAAYQPDPFIDQSSRLAWHFHPRHHSHMTEPELKLLGEQALILEILNPLNNWSLNLKSLSHAVSELPRSDREEIYQTKKESYLQRSTLPITPAITKVIQLHDIFKSAGKK